MYWKANSGQGRTESSKRKEEGGKHHGSAVVA